MLNVILGHKCVICGERDKNLESVGDYGIYHNTQKYFHRSCIKEITCDPEHFKHIQVDMAISIIEKLEEDNKKVIKRRKNFKKSCEKLSNYCVDDKL